MKYSDLKNGTLLVDKDGGAVWLVMRDTAGVLQHCLLTWGGASYIREERVTIIPLGPVGLDSEVSQHTIDLVEVLKNVLKR